MRRGAIFFFLTSTVACGGGAPSPPVVTPPSDAVTVTGAERIGWDQPAADAVELATIGYAIYVDGNRTVASGVACAAARGTAGFACTAALPPLTRGAHMLQIASFVTDGTLLESTRSAALAVNVVPAVMTEGQPADRSAEAFALRASPEDRSAKASAERSPSDDRSAKASAERSAEQILNGLVDVTDLAFAPGGRLFVAERRGTIAAPVARLKPSHYDDIVRTTIANGGEVLALAIDPAFSRTHFIVAVSTERDPGGATTFTLARFRESAGTFGDRAVLLDRVPADAPPHAIVRFGSDGNIYAAFDTGGDVDGSRDAAAFNGKLLRLRNDGTTPKDAPAMTPIAAEGVAAPVALAWLGGAPVPWVIDRRTGDAAQLREAGGSRRAFRLPDGFKPSSAIVSNGEPGDLLIASGESNVLLRVRFDRTTIQPVATERATVPEIDGIRAMTAGPDGAIYLATATSVWRLR